MLYMECTPRIEIILFVLIFYPPEEDNKVRVSFQLTDAYALMVNLIFC